MITIRVEQLSVLEYPSASQAEGKHWAFKTLETPILKFKHESVMSTAKAIYDEWGKTLNSTAPNTAGVFRKTCDLLNFGLVEIEFTHAAARRFVAVVDAWAISPTRAA
jgi:hypothetical protein